MQIPVRDFIQSSARYADKNIREAAKNSTLSKKEQGTLRADLRDDVQFYRDHILRPGQTVRVNDFLAWRGTTLSAAAEFAAADGKLDPDSKKMKLLDIFRDNLRGYAAHWQPPPPPSGVELIVDQMRAYASGLIMVSEDEDPVEIVQANLGTNPTDEQILSHFFQFYGEPNGDTRYDVVEGREELDYLMENIAADDYDPERSSHLKSEIELLFDDNAFSDFRLVSSSVQTPIGGGGTSYVIARHADTGVWVGIGGSMTWG